MWERATRGNTASKRNLLSIIIMLFMTPDLTLFRLIALFHFFFFSSLICLFFFEEGERNPFFPFRSSDEMDTNGYLLTYVLAPVPSNPINGIVWLGSAQLSSAQLC